ncbi:AAA family ATPase [Candidatus Pacearchaeota archaeon]|nr:AAA family ATPase [Candidatus Pacearchaeota archaeon]
MITSLSLIRNIGKFENCSGCPTLKKISLISAANARGKTTLSSIFRSLACNSPDSIDTRKRLGTSNQPEVRFQVNGQQHVFQNGSWNTPCPDIMVFDDAFVESNVYSGLAVTRDQRVGLHEIILGTQNVSLVGEIESLISSISQANTSINNIQNEIRPHTNGMAIDAFIALEEVENTDQAIASQEESLRQTQQSAPIQQQTLFDDVELIEIVATYIVNILTQSMSDIEQTAIEQVKTHFESLGHSGEQWARTGLQLTDDNTDCPFCGQDIQSNPLLQSYRGYFSNQYDQHVSTLNSAISDMLNGFQTSMSTLQQVASVTDAKHAFWSQYVKDMPPTPDAQPVLDAIQKVVDALNSVFEQKQRAPLEAIECPQSVHDAIDEYIAVREVYLNAYSALTAENEEIQKIKDNAQTGDPQAITAEINSLKAVAMRYSPPVVDLINCLEEAKGQKADFETQRDQKRQQLDQQRQALFPQFERTVNNYLRKFASDFEIANVSSDNRGGTPSVRYGLNINTIDTTVDTFKHTLSAGDRSTLALAYFFSILDGTQNLQNKIVIFDDPFTSMDSHRAHATIQEIRQLANRCQQLIVLSHDIKFLWKIQEPLNGQQQQNDLACIEVVTDGSWTSSTLRAWDISQVEKTLYDEHHHKLCEYCLSAIGDPKEIAPLLRMIMESYCRVAFPAEFPPGKLLGAFRGDEINRRSSGQAILNDNHFVELRDITDYANKFHHTTNPNYQQEIQNVSPVELKGYADRVFEFINY